MPREGQSDEVPNRWRSRRFRIIAAVLVALAVATGLGYKLSRDHEIVNARAELLRSAKDRWSSVPDARSASVVAHELVDTAPKLKHLPGGGTFGEAEPELLRSISRGLAPHLAELAGASGHGFGSRDIWTFTEAESMRDLFSILDQDRESALIANSSASVQCVKLVVNAGQFGPYDMWRPSSLEVGGRLNQVMQAGGEDSNLFGREANRWRDAHKDGVANKLAESTLSVLEQVPGFTETVGYSWIAEDLAKATETPTQYSSTGRSADAMRQLVAPIVLNNSFAQTVAILQGLLNAHPDLASDPDFARFVTVGRIDATKLAQDEGSREAIRNAEARLSKTYGLDFRAISDQERLGGVPDWQN
ncbi:hypothetical protein FZI91_08115 [Mycobacterium sp. CBMA271]|uniref:hypothetical protein n=1 Tax=unclassified Mycobacteroides TaxID=2618759 RepID=UPI0012DBE250|nr:MULTISPECIES: hypothetical protein [unclassified Mycobacteroides]MUM21670.1 hypothetical protein [Mycobacteroides sp. CBMA 271]